MKLQATKIILQLFIALLLLSVTSFYALQKYIIDKQKLFIVNWTWTQTINCHYVTEGNVLPSAEEMSPPEDSIFFHETSCRGGLDSREACSIESAARKHPRRLVYVFFNSPVSEVVLASSCLAKLAQFKNVRLARLHTVEYARGTALSEILAHMKNKQSEWGIELTSDLLRYISMYKYGGLYLDTDILVVKSLDSLGRNWVAREDEDLVNVAVLSLTKDGLGHKIVTKVLNHIKYNFDPNVWLHNGPGAMTRVLLQYCNATRVPDMNSDTCHGFKVYDTSWIYPIGYILADYYFKPGELPEESSGAYTHHLWNKISRDTPMEAGSPYDRLTRIHCPSMREMYGDLFGL